MHDNKDLLNTYRHLFKNEKWYNSDLQCYNYKYIIEELNKNNQFNSVLDVGSGRGNIIRLIRSQYPDIKISTSDIENFHNINDLPFYKIDLNYPESLKNIQKHDVIICSDVMEHVEEKNVNEIFKLFSEKCDTAIFTIANHTEVLNGVELHLIQKDFSFWKAEIEKFFKIKNSTTWYDNRLFLFTCYNKFLK
jgi:2-polyprenyl-3-methyl-5-hydroxy-6-metoxy-1,4-benzoquinol methylase